MVSSDVLSLLQSSGPIALNELVMRSSEEPDEITKLLSQLQRTGRVTVSGPKADQLGSLTTTEIMESSDTIIEPSGATLLSFFRS